MVYKSFVITDTLDENLEWWTQNQAFEEGEILSDITVSQEINTVKKTMKRFLPKANKRKKSTSFTLCEEKNLFQKFRQTRLLRLLYTNKNNELQKKNRAKLKWLSTHQLRRK